MTLLAPSISAPTVPPLLSGDDILRDCREFLIHRLSTVLVGCDAPAAQTVPALRRGFGAFFDEMASSDGQTEFEQAGNLTASKIKLIDDSQLEFSIALAGVAKRLGECGGKDFPKLHLRLMTLLDVDGLDPMRNPVGPSAVCAGLDEVCATVADNLDDMLEHLRIFEAALARVLPVIYAELNERLVRSGVAPRQSARAHHDARSGVRPVKPGVPNPATVATPVTAPSGKPAALYEALRTRVVSGGTPTHGGGGDFVAVDAGTLRGLFAALDMLQGTRQLDLDLSAQPPQAGTGAPAGVLHSITSGAISDALRPADFATIEALALMFDAIHEEERLPEAVKAIIDRLAIPLLKVALHDPRLFADDAHPARELVDAVACAALGLAPDVDDSHPVCAKLQEVVGRLQRDFDGDAALLDSLHAELRTFIARREQEAHSAVEQYIALAERQERRELVAAEAAQAMHALDCGDLPVAIRDFLSSQWLRVLEAVGNEHGTDSNAFLENVALARKLVWSVQPKASPAERKQLVAMLPGLLKELNEALDLIGVPRSERAPLLDACVELHSSALRGTSSAAASAASAGGWFEAGKPAPGALVEAAPDDALSYEPDGSFPPALVLAEAITFEATDGTRALLCVGAQSGARSGAASDRRMTLVPGDWLQFRLPDGSRREGRLGWIGPWRGNLLFTNPEWAEAILLSPDVLRRQWARGDASVVGRTSLFDKAAERALREMS